MLKRCWETKITLVNGAEKDFRKLSYQPEVEGTENNVWVAAVK
jgi:hypothetical protein